MELPARLGKYELVEFLGGGMSHVYRATDTVIGRTVAVKILTPEGYGDSEVRERFLLEARMAGNVSHENIISIFDFGEIEGRPYLVMEFLRGSDLRSLIKSGAAGDLTRKVRIALQIARALEYVHTQRIIHRDVKPDNVHVTDKGAVKLIDFGIAKVQDMSRTRAGYVLGTPYYMAPEQVRGETVTPQVDVYAFGILLFELMAGVRPFKADSVEQIFSFVLMQPIDPGPLKQANIPDDICALIAHCTAKDPLQRPQGFAEVCARLEQHLTAATTPAAPVVQEQPRSKVGMIVAIVAGIVILGVALGWFVTRRTPPLPAGIETPSGAMILIPAGPFPSGADGKPETISDYYIDKTEVSNAAYEKYCKERGRPLPPGFSEDRRAEPVTDITIDEARDFARWAGQRLPSMLEWEKAARGSDGRKYPWGNQEDAAAANLAGGPGKLWPVDQSGRDISPAGVLNLGGNASEFVDQLRTPSPDAVRVFSTLVNPPPAPNEAWYTFRGGSYRLPLAGAVAYEWGAIPARFHGPDLGFRCVRDARPGKE